MNKSMTEINTSPLNIDVSIILVNYNSSQFSINCVNSIIEKSQSALVYEIIIVDNNSDREDWNNLNESLADNSRVILIKSKVNSGFALGNMTGANIAQGKYLFLLNNDSILINDVVQYMFDYMTHNSSVALSVPKCIDDENKLVPSFDYLPSISKVWLGSSFCRLFSPNAYPKRKKEYSAPINVPMVSGCAMFFDAYKFYEIGGLDTNFFLYCEEEDISLRIKKNGYSISYIPDAIINHEGGGSTSRNIDIEKEFYISFFYFLDKHFGVIASSIIKLKYTLRLFLKSLRRKSPWALLLFVLKRPKLSSSLRHRQKWHDT
ncbi:glycosyltransferase family 2 protein [Dongshaea marina]|uniref:glycosyltransferase family 2 protein n=1 Tax=Dongshaea marina TaxID=2047966 RepID=UPI000D3EADF0|nr:glycosyltransferase family 2 protein [Dongshaea marina]